MRPRRSSAKTVIFSDWQRSQRGKSIYYNVPLAPLTIRRFTIYASTKLNSYINTSFVIDVYSIAINISTMQDLHNHSYQKINEFLSDFFFNILFH